jgi:hypothetical protein
MAALMVFVGALVIAVVGYDIYLHPPDPSPVGTATIEISGTEGIRFRGTVGIESAEYTLEGETPVTFTTPYRRADYVTANISPVEESGQGTLRVEIKNVAPDGKEETVKEGRTEASGGRVFLVWKPPRGGS